MYRSIVPQDTLSADAEVVCPPLADLGKCSCQKAWSNKSGIDIFCETKGVNDDSVNQVLQAVSKSGISPAITFAATESDLTRVPTDISKLSKHVYIFMHDNQITSIPSGAFESSRTYIVLNFRDNKISSIEPGAFKYPNARNSNLNLSYNKLTAIPAGVFEGN